jgi:hypothetical protein
MRPPTLLPHAGAQHILRKAKSRPRHCHAGAYAQAFRSRAFMAVGGYDPVRWPYLMEDHEIVHLLMRFGSVSYAADHYCFPSDRRRDRSGAGTGPTKRCPAAERLAARLRYTRSPDTPGGS